jgi:hypothetical protein
MASRYPYPNNTPHVALDPSASGNPIRIVFALDAAMSIAFATGIFLYPRNAAEWLAFDPSAVTPLAETVIQFIAISVWANSLVMLACIPNTRRAIGT